MALKFDRNRRRVEERAGEQLRDHEEFVPAPAPPAERVEKAEKAEASAPPPSDPIREALSRVHVFAFVGSSGTGKSTRAISVSRQYGIDHLIDDGLLINGSRIVSGTSAKKAKSKIESVRQALFADPTRSEVTRRALVAQKPKNLMILGTSDAMISRICDNLWLPQPSIIVRIEDVSSEDEMRQAKETRVSEGMHTIPVPSMEIKHEFSGYFSDPFNRLRRRRDRERGMTTAAPDSERTVVRPTFSSLGTYTLSDGALRNMVEIILRNTQGVYSLVGFQVVKEVYGIVLYLEISLYYGFNAQEVLARAQERISARIEEYTSINVIEVNIKARRVVHPPAQADPNRAEESESRLRAEAMFGAPDVAREAQDHEPAVPADGPAAETSSAETGEGFLSGPAGDPMDIGGAVAERIRGAVQRITGFFARK